MEMSDLLRNMMGNLPPMKIDLSDDAKTMFASFISTMERLTIAIDALAEELKDGRFGRNEIRGNDRD
jgi:hypothetical protein